MAGFLVLLLHHACRSHRLCKPVCAVEFQSIVQADEGDKAGIANIRKDIAAEEVELTNLGRPGLKLAVGALPYWCLIRILGAAGRETVFDMADKNSNGSLAAPGVVLAGSGSPA